MRHPETTDEFVGLLWSFPAFRSLQEAELRAISQDARLEDYIPGQVVYEQGEPASTALLLLSGRLVAQVERGAEQARVGECHPGEIIGEAALLQRETTRSATVYAALHSTCMHLTPALLELEDPEAVMALEQYLVSTLSRRIHKTNEAIHAFWEANPLEDARDSAATTARTSRLWALLSGFWK